MIRKIRRSREAREDILRIFSYIYVRNPRAAEDVFNAIEDTIRGLGRFPGVGTLFDTPNPELAGLRSTPVSGYRNYLVFFRVVGRIVEIHRVVHGAQDLTQLFQ